MKNNISHEIPRSDKVKKKEIFGLQKIGINIVQPENADSSLEEDLKNNV